MSPPRDMTDAGPRPADPPTLPHKPSKAFCEKIATTFLAPSCERFIKQNHTTLARVAQLKDSLFGLRGRAARTIGIGGKATLPTPGRPDIPFAPRPSDPLAQENTRACNEHR